MKKILWLLSLSLFFGSAFAALEALPNINTTYVPSGTDIAVSQTLLPKISDLHDTGLQEILATRLVAVAQTTNKPSMTWLVHLLISNLQATRERDDIGSVGQSTSDDLTPYTGPAWKGTDTTPIKSLQQAQAYTWAHRKSVCRTPAYNYNTQTSRPATAEEQRIANKITNDLSVVWSWISTYSDAQYQKIENDYNDVSNDISLNGCLPLNLFGLGAGVRIIRDFGNYLVTDEDPITYDDTVTHTSTNVYDHAGNEIPVSIAAPNQPTDISVGNLHYVLKGVSSSQSDNREVGQGIIHPGQTPTEQIYAIMESNKVVPLMIYVLGATKNDLAYKYFLDTGSIGNVRGTDWLNGAEYLLIGNKKYGINASGGNQTITGYATTKSILTNRLTMTYTGEDGKLKTSINLGQPSKDNPTFYTDRETLPSAKEMPIFGVYPIDADYSLLYFVNGHRLSDPDGLGKPVIYVYDSQDRPNSVTVTLPKNAVFTYLEPVFNDGENTRDFTPTKNGAISVNGIQYPYLRYKAAVPHYTFNSRGYMVKGSDIANFYKDKLTKIGFNPKEYADFVEYRVPKYKSDKTYFVSFKFNDEISQYASLNFKIKPTSITRVLMETVELNAANTSIYQKTSVTDDSHLKTISRDNDLTVVERGGVFRAPDNSRVFHK